MKIAYQDSAVTLYHGDALQVIRHLPVFDAAITDPPYVETNLQWDKWPIGWMLELAGRTRSVWCFGSLRMFMEQRNEFIGWRLSQDIVWEKHNGSSSAADRFRRVHEVAAHFYQGEWRSIYKAQVVRNDATKRTVRRKARPPHWGDIEGAVYKSEDGGPRLERSVIFARSCHGYAIHPTQKPEEIVAPLIEYSVPPGGTVCDPFAGSATTLIVARRMGRKAIGIEADPEIIEKAVARLRIEQGAAA